MEIYIIDTINPKKENSISLSKLRSFYGKIHTVYLTLNKGRLSN